MKNMDFRPLSFWSFNGDMEDTEIKSQIHQLKEQGYGGFYMHARAGLTLQYLGDDWMHACRVAVEEAKKEVGMVIESIDNIDVAYALSKKYNIEVPIIDTAYNVIYNHLDAKTAVDNLMTRNKKMEIG